MSKSAFARTIIDKVSTAIGKDGQSYNEGTASIAMQAVAQGITEYLIQNTSVTIQYAGVVQSTPPVPDPVVTDTFSIVGSCAPTGPSDDFDDWIKQIESNIIAGFQLAPMGNAGVVFPQFPFANLGLPTVKADLTAAHDVLDEDPQQKIWEIVCGGIMDWINSSAMNAVPGAATRPSAPSTGTASIVNITIT